MHEYNECSSSSRLYNVTLIKNVISETINQRTIGRSFKTGPKNPTTPDHRKKEINASLFWSDVLKKFLPLGICLFAVMQWRAYRRSQGEIASHWEITGYRMLPLRTISRCWGWIAETQLPEPMRPYFYGLYSKIFGVNMSEAMHEDFKAYNCLGDFFCRPIKENIRHIDFTGDLVSPCDGTVLHVGPVHSEKIEQVKGVTYSLKEFFGENIWGTNNHSDYKLSLIDHNKGNNLYHCVIYLAPGDYHRFHSPADWRPTHRRHFYGDLLSVNPNIAKWVPGLFCINERAVYIGSWNFGFFSYTLVGATNVGSVRVYFDPDLQTNKWKKHAQPKDACISDEVCLTKGQLFGEFRMGSTIVLVFQAPSNFKFTITPGQKLQMGQKIGVVTTHKFVDTVEHARITLLKSAT